MNANNNKPELKMDILGLFHHLHHNIDDESAIKHEIHHCGGAHVKVNPKLDYTIAHCKCGKHKIDKKRAIGHDLNYNEKLVEFVDACPEGGWHIEGGIII